MMSIVYVMWMYVILFAVIGWMRGWAKELMVSFSAITALAVNFLLVKYIPIIRDDIPADSSSLFWIRAIILIGLVYFGYQTVVSVQRLASKANRERLVDSLFGAVMGGLNGYLIAGTLLFYLDQTHYTALQNIITAPASGTPLETSVLAMMQYMPPRWLGEPTVYFAVIVILIFIIVVYI
jgi:uncharacterized membrane protein required for colicin V production